MPTRRLLYLKVFAILFGHLTQVHHHLFPRQSPPSLPSVPTGTKPYRCDQCSYSASFFSGLARHKKTHAAPEQRPHPCPDCPRRFLTRQNLREHQRRRHRRHSATLLLALAAPAPAPAAAAAPAPDPAAVVEEGAGGGRDSEGEDDPDQPPADGDDGDAALETDR